MSSQKQAVFTEAAPAPLPQFSQAIKHNGLVFCSGNIGAIPGKKLELVEGTVKDRTVSGNAVFKRTTLIVWAETSSQEHRGRA